MLPAPDTKVREMMRAEAPKRVAEIFGEGALTNPGFDEPFCPGCGCCRICVAEIDPEIRRTVKRFGHYTPRAGDTATGCRRCGTPSTRGEACVAARVADADKEGLRS